MPNKITVSPDLPIRTRDEQRILDVIKSCPGRARAIPTKSIAAFCDLSARHVRSNVRRLRVVFHQPIGSCTKNPHGYFWAVAPEELSDVAHTWFSFGIKQLIMARRLMNFAPAEFSDQVNLALTRENADG